MSKQLLRVFSLLGVLVLFVLPARAQTQISSNAIALSVWMSTTPQTISFEKQALALVQRMLASSLDTELPKRPFASWFREITGPEAGVIWQLTECGERIGARGGAEQDLPACAEANAVLPDGIKVVVVITVGTFKKGLTGEPAFFRAIVERDDQLYQVPRLRFLPAMLRAPENLLFTLPEISANLPAVIWPSHAAYHSPLSLGINLVPDNSNEVEKSPKTQISQPEPRKVSEGVVRGIAITKVKPIYPPIAIKMNASGSVEVQITISEQGRVIEAKAVTGHLSLRNAALEAARKWVFKPTTLNGVPVNVQSVLTFIFNLGNQ